MDNLLRGIISRPKPDLHPPPSSTDINHKQDLNSTSYSTTGTYNTSPPHPPANITPLESIQPDLDPIEPGTLVVADTTTTASPSPFPKHPCTAATPQTITTFKSKTRRLCRYIESEEIAAKLRIRLQVMAQEEAKKGSGETLACTAKRLQAWLEKIAFGRVETGEAGTLVRHELEWAGWLVGGVEKGVLHVKREGCVCGVEWEVE
ncbi:hypothetical protein P154DRAFT_572120 [Amniculicola lignicola CBS 123094]|uniref:Uncharacterized protein n=1 Tax=Amniculicola lignicola CBS 123094 TaxID=1392246 RepID=A0A6A5WRH1_9PLEO|nr:hypothetical protein P154DRAFT_572120 [Amniculicola lignicola CBS 123094]